MEKIIQELQKAKPISPNEIPLTTGFYAFYTKSDFFESKKIIDVKMNSCVYVGIAKDKTLKERITKCHLKNTGKSTFRRSLGALLFRELSLEPVMRGKQATRSNISNFCFSAESERILSEFIMENFNIAYCPYSKSDIEEVEKDIIAKFGYPALNIEHGSEGNPNYLFVKRAREQCRAIVKNAQNDCNINE